MRSKCTTAVCVCKKAGLNCSQLCKFCSDVDNCLNLPIADTDVPAEEESDVEVETDDEILPVQLKNIYRYNPDEEDEDENEEDIDENDNDEFVDFEYY